MKVDKEGREVMQDYGIASFENAAKILKSLDAWFDYLNNLVPSFQARAELITKMPGFRKPEKETTLTNVGSLGYILIELGRPDGRGSIVYKDDGRQRFYDQFKRDVFASEKLIQGLEKAIIWARANMSGPMFNKLLRGRDPDEDNYSETSDDDDDDANDVEEEEEERDDEISKGIEGAQ
ncbi:hypothetical protein TWF481_004109 [Arthrobotrys musiformis]|uniref:Uncharacterized protein n=1 Tax=Arthrobotrys musiformis TaxID=47236 RepID=A0AAV9WII4_9PEZI